MKPKDAFAPGVYQYLLKNSTDGEDNPVHPLQVDWSAPGCAWDGGSLLALVTSRGTVEVYEPPVASLEYEWVPVVRLSDLLLDYLKSVDFDIVRPPEEARATCRPVSDRPLDPATWLYRYNLLDAQCLSWCPTIWASPPWLPPTTLLALGSRGLLALFAFTTPLDSLDPAGSLLPTTREPVVILPSRELTCLAWHVEQQAPTTNGDGSVALPSALLATGSSNGAVHTFRVSLAPPGSSGPGPPQWQLVPLRELSRSSLRHTFSVSFRVLPQLGLCLAAAMGQALQVWALSAAGGAYVQLEAEAHDDSLVSLRWCRDLAGQGPHLMTGALDGAVKVWTVRQGSEGTKLYCDPNLCPAVPRMKQGTQLLGLCLSPNLQVLALVRTVLETTSSTRITQIRATNRQNRGALLVLPLYQTGYRGARVPSSLSALLQMAEWPLPDPDGQEATCTLTRHHPLTDLLLLSSLDTNAMLEMQFDPNFFTSPFSLCAQGQHAGEVLLNGPASATLQYSIPPDKRIAGLPEDTAQVRASSVVGVLQSYPDVEAQGGAAGGCGPGLGVRSLMAWQLLYSVNAHLLHKFYSTHDYQRQQCQGAMMLAEAHIIAHHVHASLSSLLSYVSSSTDPSGGLSEWERRSGLNMVYWIRGRCQWMEEKMPLPGQERGWEALAERAAAACGVVVEERCFICGEAVPWDLHSSSQARCGSGHVLSRCMETLLVIDTLDCWECRCCLRKVRPYSALALGVDNPGDRRPPWVHDHRGQRSKWNGVWCIFCHIPCTLINR